MLRVLVFKLRLKIDDLKIRYYRNQISKKYLQLLKLYLQYINKHHTPITETDLENLRKVKALYYNTIDDMNKYVDKLCVFT